MDSDDLLFEYKVLHPELSTSTVDKIIFSMLDKNLLFSNYVLQRKPLVVDGHISDAMWNCKAWTDNYLKQRCENISVRVEYRAHGDDRYGQGLETKMKFGELIDKIKQGDEKIYMTTQELDYDSDGRPSIYSSPMTELKSDFPHTPDLFKPLIIANINMWFGSSSQPVTSGLHHDYHDNLYILLRGEKEFTLYSPLEVNNMYTYGQIKRLHHNGRINYVGHIETNADGSDLKALDALNAQIKLETLALATSIDENLDEDEIDKALATVLDAEIDDDFDEDDESDILSDDNTDILSDIIASKTPVGDEKLQKFFGIDRKRKAVEDAIDSDNSSINKNKVRTSKSFPDNFSKVDTSMDDSILEQIFPLFYKAKSRSIKFTLKAGQMLYLPAGWFHEVKSIGSGSDGGHLAVNYWFHPPDGDSIDKLYKSPFWELDLQRRDSI
eukprot:gene12629-16934_t